MEQFAGVTISETISHPRLAAVYLRWVWFYLTVGSARWRSTAAIARDWISAWSPVTTPPV